MTPAVVGMHDFLEMLFPTERFGFEESSEFE